MAIEIVDLPSYIYIYIIYIYYNAMSQTTHRGLNAHLPAMDAALRERVIPL